MSKDYQKIGIMGVGMVGGAIKNYFEKKGIKPFLYDNGKGFGSSKEVKRADVIFVCVPTPYDKENGFDLSFIENACENISGKKIIVIKSTVLPGTTEKFQKKYPQHKFLFNPEFLVEESADEDMENPDRQIIGYTKESYDVAEKVLKLLPKAPFEKIVKSREAEMIKYFGNSFLSVKVIFANQIYNLCKKIGIDYDIVRECASFDKRIGPSHLDVHHGGYFGYGGKCLNKDIRALIQLADEQNIELKLHKTVEEINNKLMEEQGIEDPEKFSKRE
jgi:UDPglucose 6-dehydrogenase